MTDKEQILSQHSDDLLQENRYTFDSVGLHKIDNTIVYVAGDRVYTQSSDNNVRVEVADEVKFRLDIDESIDLPKAFEGLAELISLAPGAGWILLAHTISGIIRSAFVSVGITPSTILMIVGKTGMHKSSYVPLITQFYDRGKGVKVNTRFNSSNSFIEDSLCEYRHCTYVIDDIHTGSSSSIKRDNETNAEKAIRMIGDNIGRGRKIGKKSRQCEFEGNVVFIGEYTIGAESTTARMLCVELTHKIDGTVMDKYQRSEKLLVSTFYSYFIRWYVDKYEDICDAINERLTKFRESDSQLPVHDRLADTLFYLQVSQSVLLEFCIEKELLTQDKAMAIYRRFQEYVINLIMAQQDRLKPQDDSLAKVNYLSYIKQLYQAGKFKLAKDMDKFDADVHDGIIHYECLCLRKECLERIFKSSVLKSLIKELKANEALKLNSEDNKNTIQIKGGKRFYAIYLEKLGL